MVSHLLIADDMLIFSKRTIASLKGVDHILEQLARNTGLSINREKSKAVFSKGCVNK